MNSITIYRERALASAFMPYWILCSSVPRDSFMKEHHFNSAIADIDAMGQPIPRISPQLLDTLGTRIAPGETVELHLTEKDHFLFISTMDGTLSNEVNLVNCRFHRFMIYTRGGFRKISVPEISSLRVTTML